MKENVTSLKFVDKDNATVDFLMVEGEDVDKAVSIAKKWAKNKNRRPYDKISLHQGVMSTPEFDEYDIIDGFRVWNLPF